MKILISSFSFLPVVGGIQTVASILAHEFTQLGHEVKLVTQTVDFNNFDAQIPKLPFEIIRQPSRYDLLRLVVWCDVFFHNDLSLNYVWPLFLSRKPWVVTNHIWISKNISFSGLIGYVKHFILRFANCVSISQAISDDFSTPSTIIANPYNDDIFYKIPEIIKDKELIFVGRLVREKGVHIILEALAKLKKQGRILQLTIVGTGVEENSLLQLSKNLGIFNQVSFVGLKQKEELARLLNAHKVMVIPSLWQEPFGITALEGIACGCVVVASEDGGLKEAIGACGVTFPNGDVEALAEQLVNLFSEPTKLFLYRDEIKVISHLSRHKKLTVAKAYLNFIKNAIAQSKNLDANLI